MGGAHGHVGRVGAALRGQGEARPHRVAGRAGTIPTTEEASATDEMAEDLEHEPEGTPNTGSTGTQKWVLVDHAAAFGLMIFSVIPWSSIFGATTGPAEYLYDHTTAAEPYWFELNWWFPQLAMLFIIASVLVGVVARMGEKETVRLIAAGAADMIGPAMVVLLAGGVSVIMTNTQTLDTILNSMEQLVSGTSAAVFASSRSWSTCCWPS